MSNHDLNLVPEPTFNFLFSCLQNEKAHSKLLFQSEKAGWPIVHHHKQSSLGSSKSLKTKRVIEREELWKLRVRKEEEEEEEAPDKQDRQEDTSNSRQGGWSRWLPQRKFSSRASQIRNTKQKRKRSTSVITRKQQKGNFFAFLNLKREKGY